MIVLSVLHSLLQQVLTPTLHTALLVTITGHLVSAATGEEYLLSGSGNAKRIAKSKDSLRVLAGLGGEIWGEMHGAGAGMVESELGRVVVLPVIGEGNGATEGEAEALMLLVLNATDAVGWEEIQTKGKVLAKHLGLGLRKYQEYLGSASKTPRK